MKEDTSWDNGGEAKAGIRSRKQRLTGKIPPSHPDFDKSRFSNEEFIELLLFENRELQSTLAARDEKVKKLEFIIREHDLELSEPKAKTNTSSSDLLQDEVPQRSARRRKEVNRMVKGTESKDSIESRQERRYSEISITSNGLKVSDEIRNSSNFKPELATSIALSSSPEKSPPRSIYSNSHDAPLTPLGNFNSNVPPLDLKNRIVQTDPNPPSPNLEDLRDDSNNNLTRKARQNSMSADNTYKSRIKLPLTMRPSQDGNAIDLFHTPVDKDFDTLAKSNSRQETLSESSVINDSHEDQTSHQNIPGTPDKGQIPQEKFSAIGVSHSNGSRSYFDSPNTASSLACTPNTKGRGGLFNNYQESMDSLPTSSKPSVQSPGSSFNVLSTSVDEDEDVPLFIQPQDFQTVRIVVVSTISVNAKKSDNPNCTFSINDRESNKEMWRVRKSYNEIMTFDNEIRPVVEFFGLPPIPDKSSLNATTPTKVDSRMRALQDYFDTIFAMPHIPHIVLYRICRYISLGFVSPLDDFKSGAKKEGFLIRRYKGLGTTWKIRWCSIDGPALEIYDSPGGSLIEQIKLAGSQIGRQSSDVVAEERGYRHAFLILESSKSSKISGSYPKHFFCAESDLERDEWISAMVEFTENDPLANTDSSVFLPIESASEAGLTKGENILDQESPVSTGRNVKHLSSVSSIPSEEFQQPHYHEEPLSKEGKMTKMRNLFPFRNKSSHSEGNLSQENPPPCPTQASTEQSMQMYLDQMNLSDEQAKAIFGRDLRVAYELSSHNYKGLNIPSVCFRCLDFLTKSGAIYEEGIFRLSGSASTIRQLKERFNQSFDVNLFESPLKPDIHTVSGLLKTYLRELPHPIFGYETYFELQKLVTESNSNVPKSQVSLRMRDLLQNSSSMDRVNYDTCLAVFGFLRSVIAQSTMNRMSLKNVCIVFVPTLNVSVEVLSLCLVDFDCIFGNSPPTRDSNREVLDLQIPTF